MLTGSGILSVLGLLGRGTHASSSREIRKSAPAGAPLPLPTWRRPGGRRGQGASARARGGGHLRGRRARRLTGGAEAASAGSTSARGRELEARLPVRTKMAAASALSPRGRAERGA